MSINLRKALMTRSGLLNKFRKYRTNENQCFYKIQRNYCVKLIKKSNKKFLLALQKNQPKIKKSIL